MKQIVHTPALFLCCCFCCSILVFLSLASSIHAAPAMPPKDAGSQPRLALHQVLQGLDLSDAPSQGVLVAIDNLPQTDSQDSNSASPVRLPSQFPPTLADAAQDYNRALIGCGTATAIAPAGMVVLNPNPSLPNVLVGMDKQSLMRLLMSSFTVDQWSLVSRPQGFGLEDLNADQQALFNAMIANPFRLVELTTEDKGSYAINDKKKTLSDEERLKIRIRLNLSTEVQPIPATNGQGITIKGGPILRSMGETFWIPDTESDSSPNGSVFGVPLRSEVPNVSKPSQLSADLPGLSSKIHLRFDASQPTQPFIKISVGEVARQIGLQTRTELDADSRLARQPLWVHGNDAACADLIKAVCLCVTGTFRRVGPAYVLTDDILGVGSRRAVLADWLDDASLLQQEQLQRVLGQGIPALKPAQLTLFEGDPLAGNDDLLHELLADQDASYSGHWVRKKVSSLPNALRAAVDKNIENAVQQSQAVLPDAVLLRLQIRLTYIVPDAGEVTDLSPDIGAVAELTHADDPPIHSDQTAQAAPRPSLRLDLLPFHRRILYLTPSSAGELAQSFHLADKCGMTEIWVGTTPGFTLPPITQELMGRQKLTVHTVISMLALPQSKISSDLNITGKPASDYYKDRLDVHSKMNIDMFREQFKAESMQNWVTSNSPDAAKQKSEAIRLESRSDVNGVVLQSLCAPGYEGLDDRPMSAFETKLQNLKRFDAAAGDTGYTTDLRLAYLRRTGVDPVDITNTHIPASIDVSLPLFPPGDDAAESRKWKAYRHQINTEWLQGLFADVSKLNSRTALIAEETSGDHKWFGVWDKAFLVPRSSSANHELSLYEQARQDSPSALLNILPPLAEAPPSDYPAFVHAFLKRKDQVGQWDGIVLNLSDMSLNQSSLLLEALAEETQMAIPAKDKK